MQNSLYIKSIPFNNLEERIFFTLMSLLVFSVILYLYFMSVTVLSVVQRTSAMNQTKILDTKISEIESEYMSIGALADLSSVKAEGYKEIAKIDYVSRTTSLGFARE